MHGFKNRSNESFETACGLFSLHDVSKHFISVTHGLIFPRMKVCLNVCPASHKVKYSTALMEKAELCQPNSSQSQVVLA